MPVLNDQPADEDEFVRQSAAVLGIDAEHRIVECHLMHVDLVDECGYTGRGIEMQCSRCGFVLTADTEREDDLRRLTLCMAVACPRKEFNVYRVDGIELP